MRFKHLVIISILLAILTIGAASASENITSDDDLQVEGSIEEDSADDVIGDVENEVTGKEGVDIIISDTANIDEYETVVYVSDENYLNGTVKVYVGDNAYPDYTRTFDTRRGEYEHHTVVTVMELGSSNYGISKIRVTYQKNGVEGMYTAEKEVKFTSNFIFYTVNDEYGTALETDEFAYGDKIDFRVHLPESCKNKVRIKFNGKSYDVTLKNGWGSLTVAGNLNLGKYIATATYLGDSINPKQTLTCTLTVNPYVDYDDMAVGEKSAITLYAPKGTSGSATLYNAVHNIDDDIVWGSKITTVDIVNGYAVIPMENLTNGDYEYYLNYTCGNHKGSEFIYFTVYNNTPGYSSSINQVGDTVTVDITGPVSSDTIKIYLDGKFYKSATFATGKISKVITGLSSGQHKIKVLMDSGGKFYSNTFFVTVKQTKDKIKLTLKKIKTIKKSAKKLVLKATLKINGKAKKGLKIKFKFNKKKYSAKTNKKGVAKVTIKKKVLKKLKVGKKVKIQASYGKIVKKMTAKVKK